MVVDRAGMLNKSNALSGYEKVKEFVYLDSLIESGSGSTGEVR